MNMVSAGYIPGDPRLIEQIVYELKSQGIFDQFRKECIADVDTKPAYQNLRQRVEGSVNNFLMKQKFSGNMNKNQIREQLRKNISESGFLETGVERIVDQVVNPKINTVFLPKVEDVVYRYLGLEIPNRDSRKEELKVDVTDLLPNDLEAVSPESVHDQSLNVSSDNKQVNTELNENSLNSSNTKTEEDESPAFELLEENTKFSLHNENSVDLNSSEKAVSCNEKLMIVENSQDISQSSKNSFDSHLSIETSVESLKMEICNDKIISEEKMIVEESKSENQDMKVTEDTIDAFNKKIEDRKNVESKVPEDKSNDVKKSDDKSKSRNDRDKKDDKDKRSRSKSESKSKSHKDHRSSSKHSSSRDKDKERKDYRNGKEKDDSEKNKQENKNKEGDTKEKSQRSKDRNEKDDKLKSSKDKDKAQRDKDKSKSDKDRSKHSSSSSKHSKSLSSSSRKDSSYKEKERSDEKVNDKESSTSKNKDVSSKEKDNLKTSKDKDKPRLSSSSSRDKEKDKHHNDLKSRSSDKYKKSSDKSKSYHDKKSSSKKEKDKKSVDDHYSSKEKRNDRRSTDRDSNDGSSKSSRHDSFTDIQLQANKSSSKESSEVFSSGSGESNNSDAIEATKFEQNPQVSVDKKSEVLQSIKYIKPKFASNIHEAMKIMKIRKQLAKLERNNQLSLSNIQSTSDDKTVPNNSALASTKPSESLSNEIETVKSSDIQALKSKDLSTIDSTKRNSESLRNKTKTDALSMIESTKSNSETLINETKTETTSEVQTLKSKDLSMESFEALEARLAQEMSNVDYHMYGDEDDTFECSSVSISPAKKKKDDEPSKLLATDVIFDDVGSISNINSNVEIGEEIELLSQRDNNITENNDKTESIKLANTENVTQASQTLNPTVSVDTKNNLSDKLLSKDTENKGAIECRSTNKESVIPKENKLKDAQKSTKFIDDIQKNGKKCFIKIDRMDLVCSKNSKSNDINQKYLENNSLLNNIHNSIKGTSSIHNNSTKNADIKEDNIFKGEDDNAPCYYFKECNSEYKKNISNMDKIIKGLEMVIQKRTLEIHNNIPTLPKRGRKRKAPNTENNNKTPYIIHQSDLKNKPLHEMRKVEIKEALYGSDVSHNQNFSLPLSPAESDKSGEIKKEESITVKTKRTGRVSVGRANERYSNEDLYKPRPVFNYTSSRRRGRTE
ncbi:biorientation of chromosomes in cell division protein 1-like 1 isoform X2 [Sitophilus oryzae]|uniref:Biorientation of chromosomes in cell division protein 1-like 1 isoform X2 n=1 Tax=Sitophilus oryzae TaxID=7048 RepID=A0A6J2XSU6_SITOR|nr:biorientation of chromosomes in cell division protein 1-like 1 isoform X2 [Sitophilus oryzae]